MTFSTLKRTGFARKTIERKPPTHRVLARAPNGAKIVSVGVPVKKEKHAKSD